MTANIMHIVRISGLGVGTFPMTNLDPNLSLWCPLHLARKERKNKQTLVFVANIYLNMLALVCSRTP